MSDATDTTTPDAAEAAREAFFAKLADPPDNVAVVVEKAAAAEAAAEAPKAVNTAARSSTATAASSAAPRTAANGAASSGSAASTADASAGAPAADAVLEALKAGDLDRIAELTGADPADFDEKSSRHAARIRRERAQERDLERVRSDIKSVLEHYEPIETQREAFEASGGRDYGPVRAILEHVTGQPWSTIAAQLALVPASPSGGRPSPAADRVLIESLRDDVPDDHEVRRVPDWENRAVRLLRESVDEHTGDPTISFRQAAARVLRQAREDHRKLSAVFGGGPAVTPAVPATAPQRAEGAAPAARRKLTREEFLARFGGPGKE